MITTIKDWVLELRINLARRHLMRYPTRANAQHFNKLILARSAGRVARMESKIRTVV